MKKALPTNHRACFPGPEQVVLEETEWPGDPASDEILVECNYSLISPGTELAIFTRSHTGFAQPDHPFARYPFYPGYAAVGTIRAAGSQSPYREGDVVFYAGKHARYARVSTTGLVVKGGGADLRRVPFTQIATIAATARWVTNAPVGGVAVVVGLGLVGNLAAQLFRLAACRVIGADQMEERCALAHRTGIIETVKAVDLPGEIAGLTDGKGADVVVEATGSAAAITPALASARRGGEVILLGSTRGTVELDAYSLIHHKGITVKGAHTSVIPSKSHGSQEAPRTTVARQMLTLIEDSTLDIDPLISHTLTPDHLKRAYQILHDQQEGAIGILINWN